MTDRINRGLLILLFLLPAAGQAFCGDIGFNAGFSLAYPGYWRGMQPAGVDTLTASSDLGLQIADTGLEINLYTRNSMLKREEPYFAGEADLYSLGIREELPLTGWILRPGFGLYTNVYGTIIHLEYGSLVLEPFVFIRYYLEDGYLEWEAIFDTTPAQTGFYHGFNFEMSLGSFALHSTIHWASNYLKHDGGNFIEELVNLRPEGMLISLIPIEFYAGLEFPYDLTDEWELFGRAGIHIAPYRSYNFNSIGMDLSTGIRYSG